MATVMAIFNIWYPSKFSKQARKAKVDRESMDSNLGPSIDEPSDVELSNIGLSNVELQSK